MKKNKATIKIEVGKVVIALSGDASKLKDWPHPWYQSFISRKKADIFLDIYCQSPEVNYNHKLVFDGGRHWKLYSDEAGYYMEMFSPTPPHYKVNVGVFNSDFTRGKIYLLKGNKSNTAQKGWSPVNLIRPLLTILVNNYLSPRNSLMAHGLAVNDQGKGLIFVGASGAGKSTLSKMYQKENRVDILSDEYIIVRKIKNNFFIFGTPWAGEGQRACNKSVKLDKVFFIEHAPENIILEDNSIGLFQRLFTQLFIPFWDKKRLNTVLKMSQELINTVPSRRLGFIKDRSVIDFVREI